MVIFPEEISSPPNRCYWIYRFFCTFLTENNYQHLYSRVLAFRSVLLVHLQQTAIVPEHVTVPTVGQINHKGKFSQTDAS